MFSFSCLGVFVSSCVLVGGASIASLLAQQTFTGRISDSGCAASHQAKASASQLTDRQCLLACIKSLRKYVLVDSNNNVVAIANQDAMGLPLYAGRPVKITGEMKDGAIAVAKVEAIPAHLHIGHVMTNWRDTPGTRGFLPVAIDEARVAVLHAGLAAKAATLDDAKMHAGHVLHALDPTIEPKGPGAGYGVRKATTGAIQHLDLAVKAEGTTPAITTHGAQVSSSLTSVTASIDRAIATAQQIREATELAAATRLAADLSAALTRMNEGGLQPALTHMNAILEAEGLLGAPR